MSRSTHSVQVVHRSNDKFVIGHIPPAVGDLLLQSGLVERHVVCGRNVLRPIEGERLDDVSYAMTEGERLVKEAREAQVRKRLLQASEVVDVG